jgi:hypothetical protein
MDNYAAKGMNVSCRTIDGEALIFDQETRLLLQLDSVASFIWDQINGTKTIKEISDVCCQVFAGEAEEIQSSVQAFINDLEDKNVVVLSTKPFPEEVISAC